MDDAHRVEAGWLGDLPAPLPDVARKVVEVRVSKDGFVRIGNVDYSLTPDLAGRRVQATISSNGSFAPGGRHHR